VKQNFITNTSEDARLPVAPAERMLTEFLASIKELHEDRAEAFSWATLTLSD